jgi:hypothetical protein
LSRFNDPDHYDHHLICLTNYKNEQNSHHVASMVFNCLLASWNKLTLGVFGMFHYRMFHSLALTFCWRYVVLTFWRSDIHMPYCALVPIASWQLCISAFHFSISLNGLWQCVVSTNNVPIRTFRSINFNKCTIHLSSVCDRLRRDHVTFWIHAWRHTWS